MIKFVNVLCFIGFGWIVVAGGYCFVMGAIRVIQGLIGFYLG